MEKLTLFLVLIMTSSWRELEACPSQPTTTPRPTTPQKSVPTRRPVSSRRSTETPMLPPKASCKDLNEVPYFIQNVTKRFISTVPSCDVPEYVDLFETIRQNFLGDATPSTIEELYFMVKADFSAVSRRALRLAKLRSGREVEVLNELHSELLAFEKQVVDQIENYRDRAVMDVEFSSHLIENVDLTEKLVETGISCPAIQELRQLLRLTHREFENTPISCRNKKKLADFQLEKRRFLLLGDKLKVKDLSRKYLKTDSLDSENQFGKDILDTLITNRNTNNEGGDADLMTKKERRKLVYILRVMIELVKDLEVLRRSIGDELARRLCVTEQVQVFEKTFCRKNKMIYRIAGPVVSSKNDMHSWFSDETFKFYKPLLIQLIDDVRRRVENLISFPLGLDTLQSEYLVDKLYFCQEVGRNAERILSYAQTKRIYVQFRVFENSHASTKLGCMIREPWLKSVCVPEIVRTLHANPALHSFSIFTGQDSCLKSTYPPQNDLFIRNDLCDNSDNKRGEFYSIIEPELFPPTAQGSYTIRRRSFLKTSTMDKFEGKHAISKAFRDEFFVPVNSKHVPLFRANTIRSSCRGGADFEDNEGSGESLFPEAESPQIHAVTCYDYIKTIQEFSLIIRKVTGKAGLVTNLAKNSRGFAEQFIPSYLNRPGSCPLPEDNFLDYFTFVSSPEVCHYIKKMNSRVQVRKPLMLLKRRSSILKSKYFVSDTMLDYIPK